MGAIFNSTVRIAEVSAALITQCIQRAVAEQAIELAVIRYLMAGEVLAVTVLEKRMGILFHALHPLAFDAYICCTASISPSP